MCNTRLKESGRFVYTLLVAGVGSIVCVLVGLPAPILIGAMGLTFIAAMLKMPVTFPNALQTGVVGVIGISVGSTCDLKTLGMMAENWITIAVLFVGHMAVLFVVALALSRLMRIRYDTAVLSAFPGHIEVSIQEARKIGEAEVRHVAVFQGLRVVILVTVLPAVVQVVSVNDVAHANRYIDWGNLGLVISGGVVGAVVASILRIPAGVILGSVVGAGTVTLFGFSIGELPGFVIQGILLLSGTMIGCQFINCRAQSIVRMLPASALGVIMAICIMGGLAWAMGHAVDVPYGQMVLAYAPGGADIMPILAMTMGLDPALVGLHQIARVMGTAIILPMILAKLSRTCKEYE